jgi:hypothetical protein
MLKFWRSIKSTNLNTENIDGFYHKSFEPGGWWILNLILKETEWSSMVVSEMDGAQQEI